MRLHGFRYDLPFSHRATSASPDSIAVALNQAQRIPATRIAGESLAESHLKGLYFAVRTDPGDVVLRFPGIADIRFDAPHRTVKVLVAAAHLDLAAPLFLGTGVAIHLGLTGRMPLHATTVSHAGSAYVVAGDSGSGKSSLAALLCRAGAHMMSEDVVRIDVDEQGAVTYLGLPQIRLRDRAEWLADASWPTERAPDGRIEVTPPAARREPQPVGCVLFPRLVARGRVQLGRLSPREALQKLLAAPRVGWTAESFVRAQFTQFAAIGRSVAAYSVRVPLSEAIDPRSVGTELLALLGSQPEG